MHKIKIDNNNTSHWLPLNIKLKGKLVVIIGAGDIASKKAKKLINVQAKLKVIAPVRKNQELDWNLPNTERVYKNYSGSEDIIGAFIVIAATNDRSINKIILLDAQKLNILALAVDAGNDSDIMFPATLRKGYLTISFSTDGTNPLHAAKLKRIASKYYDNNHIRCLQQIIDYDIYYKKYDKQSKLDISKPLSCVVIIGAGPGDPELLTIKAVRYLQSAEIIIHDALINKDILYSFAPSAKYIDVGKRKGQHFFSQQQINELMIDLYKKNFRIVRLKGGDPCIFGRVGEEISALKQARIPFSIIPGVSSLNAIPASIGTTLTDRNHGRSIGIFSLHKNNSQPMLETDWLQIANGPETLVLFMGRSIMYEACQQLISKGRDPNLPIAVVFNGTLPNQEVFFGVLSNIHTIVNCTQINSPVLIIVGNVLKSSNIQYEL